MFLMKMPFLMSIVVSLWFVWFRRTVRELMIYLRGLFRQFNDPMTRQNHHEIKFDIVGSSPLSFQRCERGHRSCQRDWTKAPNFNPNNLAW